MAPMATGDGVTPSDNQAALGADGKLYVHSGWGPGFTTRVLRYDPAGDSWSLAPSLGLARSGSAVVRGGDGRVLCLGGAGSGCPDAMTVAEALSTTPCSLDATGDGQIGAEDLALLLGGWGICQ